MDTDSGSPLPRLFVDGVILAERFRIVRMLGAGGMGEVYEAEDMVLSRERIALKTLRASFAADEASIERLRKELLLARRITHPNVCRVHDVYEHHTPSSNRVLFFTMELLEGETLADRLSRETLTSTTALPIARQIGAALQAAHLVRVAHGDLKPANIILARSDTTRERVVVTDFGLARALPVGSGVVSTSGVSRPWGTPAYMAPEQLLSGIVTRATDIYAFGVILCELVTGQRPFTDGSPMTSSRACGAARWRWRTSTYDELITSSGPAAIPRRVSLSAYSSRVRSGLLERNSTGRPAALIRPMVSCAPGNSASPR